MLILHGLVGCWLGELIGLSGRCAASCWGPL